MLNTQIGKTHRALARKKCGPRDCVNWKLLEKTKRCLSFCFCVFSEIYKSGLKHISFLIFCFFCIKAKEEEQLQLKQVYCKLSAFRSEFANTVAL
jgi:hypothetical protein